MRILKSSIKDYIENIVPKFCFSEGTSDDSTTSVCMVEFYEGQNGTT